MLNRVRQWFRHLKKEHRQQEPTGPAAATPCSNREGFTLWPPQPIYTTHHKRGPAKGRVRFQRTRSNHD